MPRIIKAQPKKVKKSPPASKAPVPVKSRVKPAPRPKQNPVDYYNCLLTYANQNWHHPVTGQKKKITACCKDCKASAPVLNKQRESEVVKLITSYRQVGDSLAKLLKPVNG